MAKITQKTIGEKPIFCNMAHGQKKKDLQTFLTEGLNKLAATYFPTWYSSIIGTNGLNFSVRYGKRWIPIVITTIFFRYKSKTHLNLRILY